jgi:aldose 1-epimerase
MLELSLGHDSLILTPEFGAAILGWTRRGTHLFRRPSPEAVLRGHPGAMGCFPLVPYCNRIAFRRFTHAGVTHQLAANFGDHPHAIHGVGWQRPWRIQEVSPASATLHLRHAVSDQAARAWPFPFSARLTYRLTERGLTILIEATNDHSAPAPMGIGAHPWFPRAAGAWIQFQADGVWFNRDSLPVTHGPIPRDWSHADARPVDRMPLDNCFTGWHGVTHIQGMRIEAGHTLRNLQIFTPAGANFLCVEPMSHVPDAINLPEPHESHAMTMLAPGDTMRGSITLIPESDMLA